MALKRFPVSSIYYAQGLVSLVISVFVYFRFPTKAKAKQSKAFDEQGRIQLHETSPLIQDTRDYDSSPFGEPYVTKEQERWTDLLCTPKVIGICAWCLFSPVYMLMFSFFGVWLKD